MSAGVWVTESGAGRPVVLVHGSLDRSAGLLKLGRRLDEHSRVVRYDRRGYGRSVDHPGPYRMAGNVDDLADVVDATGAGPALIVGHSYGGDVALALAARDPALVAGVVTYETPLSWLDWWPSDSAGGEAMAWREDPEAAAEQFMRHLIGDERWERLPPSSRAARRREGRAMVDELVDLRAHAPWEADRITVPVLALCGEHGRPHHREGTAFLAGLLRDAELGEIAGAHHFGPNTHPDDVADRVLEFARRRVWR